MARKPDRLSANRICELTGVKPQTRATWVDRGLLRGAEDYGELDVVEQRVVCELLNTLQKGHVALVWTDAREYLRATLVAEDVMLVWNPRTRDVRFVRDPAELREAVCHGSPVHVLPLGELVAEARSLFRREVAARRPAQGANSSGRQRAKPGQARRTPAS